MHECCTVPVEKIMANEHMPGGACCLVTEETDAPLLLDCPISSSGSKKNQHRTVEHMVKPEIVEQMVDSQYYYCSDADCPVVYFSQDGRSTFTTDDLLVEVFDKDNGKDVNVCYCFNWTRGRIDEEIEETGISTASQEVAEKVRASLCECDIKNPKGVCCLGDLNAYVKEAKDNLEAGK